MKIWVDADGCPGDVKELVCRAAERVQVTAVLVANRAIRVVRSPFVSLVCVPAGPDVADAHIAKSAVAGDLAITADIPLAALLVPMGILVIDPRGELYSETNIGERLAMRNFMQDLRGAGLASGGPKSFGLKERQQFAATFDRELTRAVAQAQRAERPEGG